MKSAAGPALGVPLCAKGNLPTAKLPRKRLRRAPYQWSVATWSRALSAEAASGVLQDLTYAGRSILRAAWDALELESLEEMDFGVSQLKALPGVTASSDTVIRTMRRLLALYPGLVELVEAGCRGRGLQSVWRLRRSQTTWAEARRTGIERRRAFQRRSKNQQNASLPSREKKSTSPETTPRVPSSTRPAVAMAPMKNLSGAQQDLARVLIATDGPGLNPGGASTAAAAVPAGDASILAKAGEGFLRQVLEGLRPQARKTPEALLVARLKLPTFRREILDQAQAFLHRREAALAIGDVAGIGSLGRDEALKAWRTAKTLLPSPESPGYLRAFDRERSAWGACLDIAKQENPDLVATLELTVDSRLVSQGLKPGSLVWIRARAHQLDQALVEATPWLRNLSRH